MKIENIIYKTFEENTVHLRGIIVVFTVFGSLATLQFHTQRRDEGLRIGAQANIWMA